MKAKNGETYISRTEDVEREWWIIDAEGQTLGRLASKVAAILRGKHKPTFAPNVDTGDFVVIVNAGKVRTTGNKLDQKVYYHHSGYPGGIKGITLRDQLRGRFPERVIETAVRGMLPKNSLGATMFKKLKLYKGTEHPHVAQKPKKLEL
ncbi:MAG: 50S ribosomal protein L13 [Burkholderiales bacterium]|nr:50S ribosomal protein L13 [Anaerolineae bacterium]